VLFLRVIIHTYILTYLLTSWETNRFSGSQEIPRILWTRRLITAFTSARHLSLSWTRSIQSMPPYHTSWIFILILSFHLRLVLTSGLFPSGFSTQTPSTPLPPYVLHAQPISFFSIWSPEQFRLGLPIKMLYENTSNRSRVCNMPHQCHLLNLNISFARFVTEVIPTRV